ncbi:hypothetical protein CUJ89_34745 [Burkholderia pyrrocinia]|uniref:Uncharacterized protein n=1 Tax=Burkholderia pyrrocinia TaxID=60550 RepID=A0A2Z5N7S3_BURPY|nr:hypothetical protein CUJ89_34745 [Burkholderia pyrrocinia]
MSIASRLMRGCMLWPRSTPASNASFSVSQSGPSAVDTTNSMRASSTYTCTSSHHAPLSS